MSTKVKISNKEVIDKAGFQLGLGKQLAELRKYSTTLANSISQLTNVHNADVAFNTIDQVQALCVEMSGAQAAALEIQRLLLIRGQTKMKEAME